MERRLRDQEALAKLGEMAALVAHEVRNALAGVRGAAQVVSRRLPAESRESSILSEAVDRLDALTRIVKDMLLFAHLPAVQPRTLDVAGLVARTAESVTSDPIAQTRITIDGTVPPIQADGDLLTVAFTNLFLNSAHAMHGQGTIHIVLASTGERCQIVVVDDGPGVPVAARDKLFTPSFTTKTRGSGLGLVTAKRIVEAHGGTIDVEHPAHGGLRIVLQLPMEQ